MELVWLLDGLLMVLIRTLDMTVTDVDGERIMDIMVVHDSGLKMMV